MATKTVLEEDGTIKGFFDWVKRMYHIDYSIIIIITPSKI